MAEFVISFVIEKLFTHLLEGTNIWKGDDIHEHVERLKEELEVIEPFLRDAEANCGRGEVSDANEVWLKQFRDIADQMEDVVIEYTFPLQHELYQPGFLGSLRHWLESWKSPNKTVSKIRDIEASLQRIKDRGLSYGFLPFKPGSSSTGTYDGPPIGSFFIDDDELVGTESVSRESTESFNSSRFTDDVEE